MTAPHDLDMLIDVAEAVYQDKLAASIKDRTPESYARRSYAAAILMQLLDMRDHRFDGYPRIK